MAIHVFVYGTLKRGCSAHGLLKPSDFIGEGSVAGYTLLVNEAPYPLAVEAPPECRIYGEVYRVPAYVLARIDRYEGAPILYRRVRVHVSLADSGYIDAWMYVANYPSETSCVAERWNC